MRNLVRAVVLHLSSIKIVSTSLEDLPLMGDLMRSINIILKPLNGQKYRQKEVNPLLEKIMELSYTKIIFMSMVDMMELVGSKTSIP